MEDNHILLMRVLKIHYKDRLQVLDGALKVIKEYSNKQGSTQSEYDEISTTLKRMLNDLPVEILKYFLTMVPLPKNKDNLALNNHDAYDIRSILSDYLSQGVPALIPIKEAGQSKLKPKVIKNEIQQGMFKNTVKSLKRPVVRPKRRGINRGPIECKKLLDICAEYIVQNHATLNQDYKATIEEAWKLVNSNKYDGDELRKLYVIIRDLNKKIKWLRLLEADDITDEIIRDNCYDEDVFIQERNLGELLKEDPFSMNEELRNAIMNFLKK